MYKWFYICITRLCLALIFSGVVPIFTSQSILLAQSKKKNPAQASKYAKRGSAKAKKKDYAGALKDFQRALRLNPSASNKKRVSQLTSIIKKSGSNKTSSGITRAKMPRVSDIPTISPVKYANDIYNIAEAFEMSTRNLARATSLLEGKQKKKEFTQNVYSYENGIHAAVGYGIANSFMIEGDEGNIIIDATDSVYQAEKVYAMFQAINSNPISAIIYTHNHADHTLGAKYFVDQQDETPLIIAHESTAKSVEKIFGILNPIISSRSSKMFGTTLPEGEVINVGIGPYLSVGRSAPGYIKPNVTFDDKLKLNIAGIAFEFFHAPGETDDQIFVWLPDYQALFPGDNIYKTFPNLYTIRGTSHRDVNAWVNSLDMMIALEPKHIFPSHTLPFSGDSALETLTIYRDGIQFIHDQTIRLMNQGMHPEEIIENIELPLAVASSPYLQEFYGTVRWSVKSIFNGYLGWFTGNISELDPTSTFKRAKLVSNMVGGPDALFVELKKAIINKEMQWALEVSDLLLAIDYRLAEVTKYRAEAAFYLGSMASNPNLSLIHI